MKQFIYLQWKAFTRSASFAVSLALKILRLIVIIYFVAIFLVFGSFSYVMMQDSGLEPLETLNKFLIYYFFADLIARLTLQNLPLINVRPLLSLPIRKSEIANFFLRKSLFSAFNVLPAFFFIPFAVSLIVHNYNVLSILLWLFSIFCLVIVNNFINIFLNSKDRLWLIFAVISAAFGYSQKHNLFDITQYTAPFFKGLFNTQWLFIAPLLLMIFLYYLAHRFLIKEMYLDEAMFVVKTKEAKGSELSWLNSFGTLGTFLKNDIRLIARNKRARTTVISGIFFLFYGLIFFISPHQPEFMKLFAAFFVTGGFMFVFGQFVPSWDSSYYQLMMSQNIPYLQYIKAKWWLMVIATVISTILCSFYIYFGWNVYLYVIAGGIYNLGVNTYITLWSGAYVKSPIDLNEPSVFGQNKSFNVKELLFLIPKMGLPIIIFKIGSYYMSQNMGLLLVVFLGIIGFAFKDKVFMIIEKTYKKEKYRTIYAYKQKAN